MTLVRTCLRMLSVPGQRQELIAAFLEANVLDKSMEQEGFVSAELVAPEDDPDALLVLALWTDGEAYEGWLASPVRDKLSSALSPFTASERIEVCQVLTSRART